MARLSFVCLLLLVCWAATAEPLRIATAANFQQTLNKLVTLYKRDHAEADISISSASSGSLYQQIVHGAPYAIYLSADDFYPYQLEQKELIVAGSRRTYALGQLVYWCPACEPGELKADNLTALINSNRIVAVANPQTAPYGRAARHLLQVLKVKSMPKLAQANDISQAYQFVVSGNAPAGLLAASQFADTPQTNVLVVPQALYDPIEQQAVLLKAHADNKSAKSFYRFLWSDAAQQVIMQAGYRSPPGKDPM